jgi:hypothetical protein
MTVDEMKAHALKLLHASAAGEVEIARPLITLREYCDTLHAYEVLFEQ